MKIIVPEDCGNAPKKALIRDFNIAFAKNETEKILEYMSDDITWNMVGNKVIHGKKEAGEMLKTMEGEIATELIMNTIITHGSTAAANGEMRFPSVTIAFCDVYEFSGHDSNAKIKTLTSYGIELT